MSTNKHATIRYQALDKCFSNRYKKFFMNDLVEACNQAIYDFTGIENGAYFRNTSQPNGQRLGEEENL